MSSERDFQAVNSDAVNAALASEEFIHKSKCGDGIPLHTFYIPGQTLTGRLRPCRCQATADRAKTAELHYKSASGQDCVVAIRLTKILKQAIIGGERKLWGQLIRITYKGSVRGRARHATKLYLVEVDRGDITPKFEGVEINESRKPTKPRKRKPIRRPLEPTKRKPIRRPLAAATT